MYRKYITKFILIFLYSYSLTVLFADPFDYPRVINGELIKNNKKYRAVGVNYYDAFYRVLKDNNDTSYEKGFKQLLQYRIPFVRINGGGYYPEDWNLYLTNKEKYFTLLDKVIKTAEKNKIGIVFSFFWRYDTIPKMMNEPIDAYGIPDSKTIAFIEQYTRDIIERYVTSSAIWGWEFGNEYNLKINLPPQLFGSLLEWNESNILKLDDLNYAFTVFNDIVKDYDPDRLILSGNGLSRIFIYYKTASINTINIKKIYKEIIDSENNPFNSITLHIYPWSIENKFFYKYFNYSIDNFLNMVSQLSLDKKKVIYIGEFGFFQEEKDKQAALLQEYLQAFKDNNVSLASIWVYDRKDDTKANINTETLKSIMNFNKNFQTQY